MRRLPLNVRTALLYCGLVIAGYDTARLSITALASGIQALATVPAGGTGLTALTLNSLLAGNGTSPVQLIGNPNDNTQALCGSNPPAFGTTCKGSGGGGTPGSTYFTYVNATGVGPNNTAAETSLIGTATTGSKTIPANTFVAGSFTQAVVNGQITTPVVPNNLVLNMYMGATKIATGTITGTNIASLGTQSFILNVGMGTLTGGATCAMVIESASLVSGAIIGGTVVNFQGTGTTFDCTATQAFDVKAQWGMAQVGQSIFGMVAGLYTPGAPVTSVQGLTGAITITDANLSTSDVTTNDCSTTKHGFAPKAPNDATKFLNGVCGYTAPAGGVTWFTSTFVAPVPANWSAFGSGCTTSTVTGITGANALKVVSSTGAQNTCGLSVSVAAGDFSHVFVMYGVYASVNFATVAVGFSDATKIEYCGLGSGSAGGISIQESQAKATALTGGSLTAANGPSVFNPPFVNPAGPSFFRLTRTGTNLACDFSPDGVNYINMFNDTAPFMTASELYFGTDPRTSTVTSAGFLESYN